jgi:hypothetical protein
MNQGPFKGPGEKRKENASFYLVLAQHQLKSPFYAQSTLPYFFLHILSNIHSKSKLATRTTTTINNNIH